MSYTTKLITDKTELIEYKEQIRQLFKLAFDRELEDKLWNWAFIDNTCGAPIVALRFYEDLMVGHYAVTPFHLTLKGNLIKGVLSMTTMVHPDHHKKGIFVDLAESVYDNAQEQGYDLVFGFPNKNSAPGFERKLQWIIDKDYYVVKIKKSEVSDYIQKQNNDVIKFDINNEKLLHWRLSKHNCKYTKASNNLILKEFDGDLDVLYHEGDFSAIDDEKNLCIISKCKEDNANILFDYVFGYRFFNEKYNNIPINPSLILSDVF